MSDRRPETKSSFSRIRSCHVYALSASSQLVCPNPQIVVRFSRFLIFSQDYNALYDVAQAVRGIDISADGNFLASVGKVVSDDVKVSHERHTGFHSH